MTSSVDTAARRLPLLELPDWLPGSVAEEAETLYEGILQQERQWEGEPAEAGEWVGARDLIRRRAKSQVVMAKALALRSDNSTERIHCTGRIPITNQLLDCVLIPEWTLRNRRKIERRLRSNN